MLDHLRCASGSAQTTPPAATMHAASAASDHGGRRTISAEVATTASMNAHDTPMISSAARLTAAIAASVAPECGGRSPRTP